MPAVVRVKRRIDEEPLSAFILNGKKRRLSDTDSAATEALRKNENHLMSSGGYAAGTADAVAGAVGGVDAKDEISTILKFAGTVEKPDDLALTQYARLTKHEAKDLIQRKSHKPQNATERARQEMRQSTHENRFRVVNCLRTTLDTANATDDNAKEHVTIVDIEKQSGDTATTKPTLSDTNNLTRTNTPTTSNSNSMNSSGSGSADSDTGYVYDLYIPENDEQAQEVDLLDDYYLSVKYYNEYGIWDLRDNLKNEYNEDSFDSEDSNDENCAGNDYPDEDEFSDCKSDETDSENENIGNMRRKLDRFGMIEEFSDDDDDDDDDDEKMFKYGNSDSEDDESEDPYVGYVDADDANFVDDVDFFTSARKRLHKYQDAEDGDDDDDDEDNNVN